MSLRWLAAKTVRLVVTVLALTTLTFSAQGLLPGDPAELIGFGADPAQIDAIRTDLRLDQPLPVRYAHWLGDFVRGDIGDYYRLKGNTPAESVRAALPISLLLVVYSVLLSLLIAVPLGVHSAAQANGLLDKSVNGFAFLAISIPAFVLAFLLKKFIAIDHQWLPIGGWVALTTDPVEHLRHVALPVLTLSAAQIAIYVRLLRSDMIDTLQQGFIQTAYAKGLPTKTVLYRHALPASATTLVTVAGMNVGLLIGGAVLVERVFGVPGMGSLLVEGISSREYPATQSFIAIIAILFVVANFAVDLLYAVLDPRIRRG